MYLPAETIHYEVVSGKTGRPARVRARAARVPGLGDDLQRLPPDDRAGAEGHADRAARGGSRPRYCAALQQEFGKFKEDFDLVGTHLAHGKYADAEKRLDRFETKLDQAADEQVELGDRRAPARPRCRLEPEQRGEAADRFEVAVLLADHLDRPTVRQRLTDGEIEAGFGFLERRPAPAGSSHR